MTEEKRRRPPPRKRSNMVVDGQHILQQPRYVKPYRAHGQRLKKTCHVAKLRHVF
jgi:hypothetical protein